MSRAFWLVAALLVGACGDSEDPRPASWDYLSPALLQPSCATASCHSPAAAAAGLDFSTPERGYTSLTRLSVWIVDPDGAISDGCRDVDGVRVCQRPTRPLVNAFNPAQSRLLHVLRAEGAPRMPPDRPLAEADIALVERWILEGAREHSDAPDGGP